jgi:LacI family transcriptional regulator
VIGFDDIYLAHYSRPKLTTLHYPVEAIAKHAALLAINKHTQLDKTAHSHRYQPTLVERQSTTFAPTSAKRKHQNESQIERQN